MPRKAQSTWVRTPYITESKNISPQVPGPDTIHCQPGIASPAGGLVNAVTEIVILAVMLIAVVLAQKLIFPLDVVK